MNGPNDPPTCDSELKQIVVEIDRWESPFNHIFIGDHPLEILVYDPDQGPAKYTEEEVSAEVAQLRLELPEHLKEAEANADGTLEVSVRLEGGDLPGQGGLHDFPPLPYVHTIVASFASVYAIRAFSRTMIEYLRRQDRSDVTIKVGNIEIEATAIPDPEAWVRTVSVVLEKLIIIDDDSLVAADRTASIRKGDTGPAARDNRSSKEPNTSKPHVFMSYVHADADAADKLVEDLRSRGVNIWKDRDNLEPGDRWKRRISEAIEQGYAFLAVFSKNSEATDRSYMREELIEATNELRLRPDDRAWFYPVLLSPCNVPRLRIGPGEFLDDLQFTLLYEDRDRQLDSLASALQKSHDR